MKQKKKSCRNAQLMCLMMFALMFNWPMSTALTCQQLTSTTTYDPEYYDKNYEASYSGESHGIDYHENDTLGHTVDLYLKDLKTLFGSSEKTYEAICYNIRTFPIIYWRLDQALYEIEIALNKTDEISEKVEEAGNDVMSAISNEMISLADSSQLYKLNKSRNIIDCALGRSARNEFFTSIEISLRVRKEMCKSQIIPVWWNLTSIDYTNKSCTFMDAMEAVAEISQVRSTSSEISREHVLLKRDLLMTLSEKSAISQLNQWLCEGTSPSHCPLYEETICASFDFRTIENILTLVKNNTKKHLPSDPKAMILLIKLQQQLGEVSIRLTSSSSLRTNLFERESAKDLMKSYFGIVDSVIGSSSVNVWRQARNKNVLEHFQEILLESEIFAGCTSDKILLAGGRYSGVNQSTLDVQMKQVFRRLNKTRQHQSFHFDSIKIWTDELSADKDWNIIAVHYKSLHEVLNEINGKETDFFQTNNSRQRSDDRSQSGMIIGNGGVVSLSARTEFQPNKSVPVYYRVEFTNQSLFINVENATGRRCLSCRYLDGLTKTWKTNGCDVKEVNEIGLTCKCNHTTNFATFMSPFKIDYNATEVQGKFLTVLKYFGLFISTICLFFTLTVFALVRKYIRHNRMKAHFHLVVALLMVHLVQFGSEAAVVIDWFCIVVTMATHYLLLVVFIWMLIEGIFLYFFVIKVFMMAKLGSANWMYPVGWGIPLIIVGISAGYGIPHASYVQASENAFECDDDEFLYPPLDNRFSVCWLSTTSSMTWAFVGPALFVIAFNFVIFCKVLMVLVKAKKRKHEEKSYTSSYASYSKPRRRLPTENFSSRSGLPESSFVNEDQALNKESFHDGVTAHMTCSTPKLTRNEKQPEAKYTRKVFGRNLEENNAWCNVQAAVKASAILLPLLGIPWILGLFGSKSYELSILFIILVSLQGPAIFLLHCVFNKEVTRAFRRHSNFYGKTSFKTKERNSSSSSVKSIFRSKKRKRGITSLSTISKSAELL